MSAAGAVGPEWSTLLREAATRLAAAGVDSPRTDAELLLAHVLRRGRGEALAAVFAGSRPAPGQAERFEDLVSRRVRREPLQHLTGAAPFHGLDLAVGPGVFVPRPETELLVDAGLAALEGVTGPAVVVDLCTGSGAIAAAVAAWARGQERLVRVVAVEQDAAALAWAARNLTPLGVELRHGDARVECEDLLGEVDVVVTNPPYVPEQERPAQPEALADPPAALYGGGGDGLSIPRDLVARAARLLRPGGVLVMEHHDTQGPALVAEAHAVGAFAEARTLADATGRDRFLRAVRSEGPGEWNNGPCE